MNSQKLVSILIDDNILVRRSWIKKANRLNLNLVTFKSFEDFFNSFKDYFPEDTEIYIDSELGNGILGEVEIKKLYDELGYRTIKLVTAKNKDDFDPMYWIADIIGKDPPW